MQKWKKRNICLKCPRITEIPASYRKSRSGNTMVTSDFWPEVEIWPFCACSMKNMQFGYYAHSSVMDLWTRLWGRYHVPQNVFLVPDKVDNHFKPNTTAAQCLLNAKNIPDLVITVEPHRLYSLQSVDLDCSIRHDFSNSSFWLLDEPTIHRLSTNSATFWELFR